MAGAYKEDPDMSVQGMAQDRVLILRALGLGDFLTAVPGYRALRRARPDAELVLAAPAALAALVPLTGAIDRVLPTAGLAEPLAWPGPPPGLAVNLHGRGPRSHRLLAATGAARTLAFRHPAVSDVDGPEWRPDEHEVRRWCRLLDSYGIHADPDDLLLDRPEGPIDATGAVLVHPGANAAARRWPPARFAAVAAALAQDGHRVLVTGSAAEHGPAAEVAHQAGLPAADVLAGRTDLLTLAAAIASAALLICGDTGVGHLATALGTRSVLLFGPTPPSHWGPLRDPGRHTVLWAGVPGDPHATTIHAGLAAITTTDVLAAARTQLAGTLSAAG
jgi:ADP-heptose:LPS heptosyltransferase